MHIIKPIEIASKIMCLIDEAEEFVVLVSPYYNFNNWRKLNRVFESAIKRGIDFDIYVRAEEAESIQQLMQIGFMPKEITRLHAKIYFNEKEAIVSSMNLNISSDNDSLDIGLQTQSKDEYEELIKFHEKFIKAKVISKKTEMSYWLMNLDQYLSNIFDKEPFVEIDENILRINGDNRYEIFIANEKPNLLRLNCVLSDKELQFASGNESLFPPNRMAIELIPGTSNYYNMIWGTVTDIKSNHISNILETEAEAIKDIIVTFVKEVETMKKKCYE